jgi:hypothetical protein
MLYHRYYNDILKHAYSHIELVWDQCCIHYSKYILLMVSNIYAGYIFGNYNTAYIRMCDFHDK